MKWIKKDFNDYLEDAQIYNESGIRNMNEIARQYKKAEIYYHIDLDGVTSAIAMKKYIQNYGIEVVSAHRIQYGDMEFAITKDNDDTLKVLVDFAHGKPMMRIHTDHHDKQIGVNKKEQSTSFAHSPSNAEYISSVLSPRDIFPPSDAKFISVIDSADFAKNGYTVNDVLQVMFSLDSNKDILSNKANMGFCVNKLLLAYKNKPEFLDRLVMQAEPSLISMYQNIKSIARDLDLDEDETIEKNRDKYIDDQKNKYAGEDINLISALKSGEQLKIGNIIVQYGGGYMVKTGSYDRYIVFKNNPDGDFLCIGWPMGLVQVSKNPFKKGINSLHFGEMVMKNILPKYESELRERKVSLAFLKKTYESTIEKKNIDGAVGFTFNDLLASFESKLIKGMKADNMDDRFTKMILDISRRNYKDLSPKQIEMLTRVNISLWDVIISSSGGHKDITNISGLNFYGQGYVEKLLKPIMKDIVEYMVSQNVKLEG